MTHKVVKGKVATLMCNECGAVADVVYGHITRAGIEHEPDCAFYAAVEAGVGEAWAKERGYPIRLVSLSKT